MILRKTSIFPASREAVYDRLRRLKTLQYISAPYASFTPIAPNKAYTWREGAVSSYYFKLFGIIPLGRHTIKIEHFDQNYIQSRESNPFVPVWDHLIILKDYGDQTEYTDEVVIQAGWKTVFPDITCVIARVPSYFVSEGLRVSGISKNPSGTSCWNYHGKELPFAPYRSRKFNMLKMLMKEKELHILTFNRGKIVTPETAIPVEKINGPILLLSSKHDEVWESYKSAVLIEKRLNQASFPFAYRHIAFPYLSHAMMTDFSPMYKMIFKRERYFPKECAAEREQLKHELLNWINHIW